MESRSMQPTDKRLRSRSNDGSPPERRCWNIVALLLGLSSSCLVILYLARSVIPMWEPIANPGSPAVASSCENPPIRREWRQLSPAERDDYIRSVQCLRGVPSQLGLNQTLYDDFPWVHSRIGNYSHDTAAFLSWHRYFIHVYERTLQDVCGYAGVLTYWDWSLDWEDFARSPVWDPVSGFGGDGNATGPITVGNESCVTDGPFAGLTALYYDTDSIRHCLSRGFNSGEEFREKCIQNIKPDSVASVLDETEYSRFNIRLEHGPHIGVPFCVRGDFMIFTAPYDPVFFLHHTQLDRLWWEWQQRDLDSRLTQYSELSSSNSTASLSDILDLGDFASGVRVADIMNTEHGILCYRY